MRRGNEFLLACIRLWGGDDERARQSVRELVANAPDDALYPVAHDSHLAPVAYSVLKNCGLLELTPGALSDKLRNFYHFTAARNAIIFRNLAAFLDGAWQRGVDVMLLKGAALISRGFYPDKGLRFLSDIDVLVRRDDVPAAYELLKELGWERGASEPLEKQLRAHHHLNTAVTDQGIPVDVHFQLSRLPLDMDLGDMWDRSVSLAELSPAAHAPSREDLLIHIAINTSMHHPDRLIQQHLKFMADLSALTRGDNASRFDWGYVFETARKADIETAVIHPLALANELLELPWLGDVLKERGALDRVHGDFLSRVCADIREGRPISDVSWMVVRMGETMGIVAKLRVLFRIIFPGWEELVEIYPRWAGSRWHFFAYFQRIGHLIRTFRPGNFSLAYRAGAVIRGKRGRRTPPSNGS